MGADLRVRLHHPHMAYAEVTELARVLKIRNPTSDQEAAMDRVLEAAAGEIDDEIDLATGSVLSATQTALVEQINLDRAAELWHMQEVRFGVVGLGTELGPTHIARDTWEKYAIRLAGVKDQWGIA